LESRDPTRLRRYLVAYAINTAGVLTDQALLEAAGVNHTTAGAYERLLTDLFVIDRTASVVHQPPEPPHPAAETAYG
jgi:hypothetical protein